MDRLMDRGMFGDEFSHWLGGNREKEVEKSD